MALDHTIEIILQDTINLFYRQSVNDQLKCFALEAVIMKGLKVVLQMQHAFPAAFIGEIQHGVGCIVRRYRTREQGIENQFLGANDVRQGKADRRDEKGSAQHEQN